MSDAIAVFTAWLWKLGLMMVVVSAVAHFAGRRWRARQKDQRSRPTPANRLMAASHRR